MRRNQSGTRHLPPRPDRCDAIPDEPEPATNLNAAVFFFFSLSFSFFFFSNSSSSSSSLRLILLTKRPTVHTTSGARRRDLDFMAELVQCRPKRQQCRSCYETRNVGGTNVERARKAANGERRGQSGPSKWSVTSPQNPSC